jgi:hypothetical protein
MLGFHIIFVLDKVSKLNQPGHMLSILSIIDAILHTHANPILVAFVQPDNFAYSYDDIVPAHDIKNYVVSIRDDSICPVSFNRLLMMGFTVVRNEGHILK